MHASKASADGSLKGHQMSDALVMRQLVRVGAKRKAADNLDMRPFKIIARTLCEVNTGGASHGEGPYFSKCDRTTCDEVAKV